MFTRTITLTFLFVLSVTASLHPRFSNTTTTKSLLESDGKFWKYAGCATDPLGFEGFTEVLKSDTLTIESCIAACPSTATFAGLNGEHCFCSATSSNSTRIVADSTCNLECPGDSKETCGGTIAVDKRSEKIGLAKRQIVVSPGMLLTLYETVSIIPPSVYVDIAITNYVAVCETGLTTLEYTETQTKTHCGCLDYTPPATVPMITTVGSCACGPNGEQMTYTVTVPQALATAPSAGLPGGNPAFTGAAVANGRTFGIGAALGAAGIAALL